jgi:hypothetical protein
MMLNSSRRFVDRYFDLICIVFGCIAIAVNNFLNPFAAWAAFLAGIMLVIISSYNLLMNSYCRDKLLHGTGLDDKITERSGSQ